MESKMTLINAEGKEIECDIVARFQDNNKLYVAYTDGTTTGGELDLFISRYSIDGNQIKLEVINDDAEWQKINKILDELLDEEGV